jgi:hypothetical protein
MIMESMIVIDSTCEINKAISGPKKLMPVLISKGLNSLKHH